ncbi:hypothetical protein MMC25_005667 [Agyrium rufum]|nr:hypothetical protein [Agyrium rufum]
MAYLLTGGTGKVTIRLASRMQQANLPFLLTSRQGPSASAIPENLKPITVEFDWLDESTYEAPFQHQFPGGEKIIAVSMVAPKVANPDPPMIKFLEMAVSKYGVKRFIVIAGSSAEKENGIMSSLWSKFEEMGVEYCILRATWFNENFSEGQYLGSIKSEGKIYTACGDGLIPFVACNDIATMVYYTLTAEKIQKDTYRVLGPELLTYDDAAAILSKVLGRDIVHVKLSEQASYDQYTKNGFPPHLAKVLSYIEAGCSKGVEERTDNAVEEVTGKKAQNFEAWIKENKAAFL